MTRHYGLFLFHILVGTVLLYMYDVLMSYGNNKLTLYAFSDVDDEDDVRVRHVLMHNNVGYVLLLPHRSDEKEPTKVDT